MKGITLRSIIVCLLAVLFLANTVYSAGRTFQLRPYVLTPTGVFIYVEPNGVCGGKTPCFSTIHGGVNAAGYGATIKVAQGTYYENVNMSPSSKNDIALSIQGGWDSSFTSRSNDPSLTVVDGNNSDRVFYIWGDFDYEVYRSISVTIDGFTIINGSSGGIWDGGGVWIYTWDEGGNSIDLTLTNNIITANSGDGVYLSPAYGDATITMTNNIIKGNSGSGVFLFLGDNAAEITFDNNIIADNSSEGVSVIAWNYADIYMINNIITDNAYGILYYPDDGGYISSTILNSTITGNNYAGFYATSSFFDGWLDIDMINTLIWGNTATGFGNDIYLAQGSPNSPVTINASYSDIGDVYNDPTYPGTYNDLGNNINTNPLFVDAANGNYHLSANSPLIDLGTNNGAPVTDFEGDVRPFDGDGDGQSYADIGADEYITQADNDGDGIPDSYDNCPSVANRDQADLDADGIGDACDEDVDGDGVLNSIDQCASTPIGYIIDPSNGCTIDQLNPCQGPRGTTLAWKNHGKYVSSVAKTAASFLSMKLITKAEKKAIISASAKSTCGQKKEKMTIRRHPVVKGKTTRNGLLKKIHQKSN